MAERPELDEALKEFPWREDTERVLVPLHTRLTPHLDDLAPLWTHNDWHASKLLWDADGRVATVLDFGMSDRTTAVHDLATAIERNAVQWLQPGYPVPSFVADDGVGHVLLQLVDPHPHRSPRPAGHPAHRPQPPPWPGHRVRPRRQLRRRR
ncbi:phosphotransferase [Streptomyces sp. NPDC001107]